MGSERGKIWLSSIFLPSNAPSFLHGQRNKWKKAVIYFPIFLSKWAVKQVENGYYTFSYLSIFHPPYMGGETSRKWLLSIFLSFNTPFSLQVQSGYYLFHYLPALSPPYQGFSIFFFSSFSRGLFAEHPCISGMVHKTSLPVLLRGRGGYSSSIAYINVYSEATTMCYRNSV